MPENLPTQNGVPPVCTTGTKTRTTTTAKPELCKRTGSVRENGDGSTTTAPADNNSLEVVYEAERVELKRSIHFTGALAILLGNIGGSSIFIAPTTILTLAGSPGLAVLMWCVGGLVTLSISVSVCELALLLPKAGGPYVYTLKVFGNIPGFIILWGFIVFIGFPSWALSAYTGALYILSLFSQDCAPPEAAVKLLAAWLLVGLVAINCTYTSFVTKLQSVFTCAKAVAMIIIIISAMTTVRTERTMDNLKQFMDNSNTDFGRICLSVFAGYFSYGGWQIITILMEEVEAPVRDVPRALVSAMLIAIVLFSLTNMAFYMVLTPQEALQSDAIAMTYGRQMHPALPYVLTSLISCCCIGAINVVVMGQPRILYAAACLGHMPRLFAMLHHKFLTPWPATFTMFAGAMYMLLSRTVSSLINYVSLYVCIMLLTLLLALIYLRYSNCASMGFQVPMVILIAQAALTMVLLIMSVYEKPHELGYCLLILASAIPVYLVFIECPYKPRGFHLLVDNFTNFIQKLFVLELPSTYMDNHHR